MKILITGANGFVGHYVAGLLLKRGHSVIATGRGECRLPFAVNPKFTYRSMDFTDPFQVHDIFEEYKPEVVVHAGAMSSADACEQDQWPAYVANVEATVTLLINAEECGAHFIFLSTDFVFDGENAPYDENAERKPVNFYGKTKVEAEDAVKEFAGLWTIVRTVLVYGNPNGTRDNLLTIVKKKIENGESYSVFDDQVKTPTFIADLVWAIAQIVEKKAGGIFHISGADVLTPYQMAVMTAKHLKLDSNLITRITVNNWKQIAKRPANTIFNIEKARKVLNYQPVSFEEGLKRSFA